MSVRCTVAAAKTRASVLCAPVSEDYLRALRARHPGFREALMADAKITAAYRGERHEFRSRRDAAAQLLRLALVSDAFLAQALYRAKAALQARGVPLLPRIAHRLAMAFAQVSIGDPVVVQPGVYILHGQVVIDGTVEIGTGVTIAPFVTIGLRAGDYQGPRSSATSASGPARRSSARCGSARARRSAPTRSWSTTSPPGATVVGVPARVR